MDANLQNIFEEEQLVFGDNNGGLIGKLFLSFQRFVLQTNKASKRRITSETVMQAGAQVYSWDCIMDKGKLENAMQGEMGGKSIAHNLSMTVIGMTSKTLEQLDAMKNRAVVAWFMDNNGRKWQLGDEFFEARVTGGGGGIPEGYAGLNNVNLTLTSIAMYQYDTTLPVIGGTLLGVVFGTPTFTLGSDRLTVIWTNNAGTGNALAGDKLFIEAHNETTGEVISSNGTALRSTATINLDFVDEGLTAGDKIRVYATFRRADNSLIGQVQPLPELTAA